MSVEKSIANECHTYSYFDRVGLRKGLRIRIADARRRDAEFYQRLRGILDLRLSARVVVVWGMVADRFSDVADCIN